jgi:DNA processing protein
MSESLAPELQDLLALHLIEGLGPHRISALIEHLGSAARVRQASAGQFLAVPGIGEQLSLTIAQALPHVELDAEIAGLAQHGVDLVAKGQPNYPAYLASIPSAPLLLFQKGTLLNSDERSVALVGTRHPDAYGKKIAKHLAEGLARAGVVVVSGLARGIDGISHVAALETGGRTLAVLAGGLSRIYPPEHTLLAERVMGAGALLTESTMFAAPTPPRFPARNRIISGLSRVIVIVQAPVASGALITAEHAAEQGRTVMAVPGPIDSEKQGGCHKLIRDGAALCRSVEDILEELDGVSAVETKKKSNATMLPFPPGPPPGLDAVQQRIWDYLGEGPRAADELARQVQLAVPQLSTILLTLEMKKVVRRLPGNRYERC